MTKFYKIENHELVREISSTLDARHKLRCDVQEIAEKLGFDGAGLQANNGESLGTWRCRGFYKIDGKQHTVDKKVWMHKGTGTVTDGGNVSQVHFYLPRKTNKKSFSEISKQLPIQFLKQYGMDDLLNKLCSRNWFFGGVTKLAEKDNIAVVRVSGDTEVINEFMIEIKESEYLSLQGK